MKKCLCFIMSVLVFLTSALPGAAYAAVGTDAGSDAKTEVETETGMTAEVKKGEAADEGADEEASYRIWQTDIRMSIQNEKQLMQEAGMNPEEWDEALAESRRAALKHPYTKVRLRKSDPNMQILEEDGRIYYIGPSGAFAAVKDAVGAYGMAYRLIGMLGGSGETDLFLRSKLGINGQTVYSFQESAGCETVRGSTMKIALNDKGRVTAVFANIGPDDSEDDAGSEAKEDPKDKDSNSANDGSVESKEAKPLISRQEAETIALEHCGAEGGAVPGVFSEYTERTFLYPFGLETSLDLENEEDPEPMQLAWIVYIANESEDKETFPYVAHYVKQDGEWLHSLPVSEPGSEEALSGFRKQDVFEGMTADKYTGTITDIRGGSRTITVPVMKNKKDGQWYLGDVDRRIAVADFYTAAYDDEHRLDLVKSGNNSDWDNEDLFMYYNYIRAWDFYADMGWIGPDGQGSDVIILKGLAFRNHTVYENACSIGQVENWQMFGYAPYGNNGKTLGYVQGLDVMAHEYTHTFTSDVMNDNLYENDQGAINEAMSDIMGNLVEYICGDTDDTRWELGENTGTTIRCMSDPKSKRQPEYVWDLYYGPHAKKPATINDRGGVHSNSSLLNRIAALLCLEYGMSYEEAVSFWLTAAMGLTPRTDYRQMRALLTWAAVTSGNEDYLEALESMIAEERLDTTELPETFPAGQKLVRLRLPATEAFADDNWGLMAYQMDTKALAGLKSLFLSALLESGGTGDGTSDLGDIAKDLAEHMHVEGTEVQLDEEETKSELGKAFIRSVEKAELVTQLLSWEAEGTKEVLMVAKDEQPTLYVLLNISAGGSKVNGMAVLAGGRWYDPFHLSQGDTKMMLAGILMKAAENKNKKKEDSGARREEYLPTEGLETVELTEIEIKI